MPLASTTASASTGCAVADDKPAPVATLQPGHGETEAAVDAVEQGTAEAGRVDPAGPGEPPAAHGDRPAGQGGGFVALDEAAVIGRQRLRFDDAALGILVSRIARHVQHAGPAGAQAGKTGVAAAAEEKPGAQQAGEGAVVQRRQRTEHAGQVARGPRRRACGGLDYGHRMAVANQRLRHRGAGNAGADHGDVLCRACARGAAARQAAAQHLALAAEAGPAFDGKVGAGETAAHLAGRGPGGECGARRGEAADLGDDRVGPELRIAVGREAVEVDRIGGERQLRQQLGRIAEAQGQRDVAQVEPVGASAGTGSRRGCSGCR
jgi:hypothetical protein